MNGTANSSRSKFGRKLDQGQAAVETAIVMPLMIFMVLGIIQLGLISQARALAKYAAYRAVRVGVMNNADQKKMEAAAMLHLLPVLALPSGGGADTVLPTRNAAEVGVKYMRARANNALPGGLKQVEVVVCGPIKSELDGSSSSALPGNIRQSDQQFFYGTGSANEVDFDDPKASSDNYGEISDATGMVTTLRAHLRTKLRIQVQLHYRMPIPFANWVLANAYLGVQVPAVLRLGRTPAVLKSKFAKEFAAAQAGVYTVPINVGYAMRMQSNLFLAKNAPPGSNKCVHYNAP